MACTILTRLVETQLGWLIVRRAQMTLSVFDFSCNKKGKTRTRCCLVWRAKKLRQNNSNPMYSYPIYVSLITTKFSRVTMGSFRQLVSIPHSQKPSGTNPVRLHLCLHLYNSPLLQSPGQSSFCRDEQIQPLGPTQKEFHHGGAPR